MIIILICLILCVCGCVHDFKNEDHEDVLDVMLAIASYFLSCLISICVGCMICCLLQLFLPNSLEDENYNVSDVYFSNELVPESFENVHVVKFLATDSDGKNTKIAAFMSNIRVEYSDNTTDTVITKYKAYSFKKWYRYIYDSPNEFYYVITFPQYKAVGEETEEETTTTQENTTTITEETTTTTTEETTASTAITTTTTIE